MKKWIAPVAMISMLSFSSAFAAESCGKVLLRISQSMTTSQSLADLSMLNTSRAEREAKLAELQAELNKPESQRTQKDPRWFKALRRAQKNPVTLKLQADIKKAQEELELLTHQKELFIEAQQVNDLLKPAQESELKNWALGRMRDVQDKLGFEINSRSGLDKFKQEIDQLKEDVTGLDQTPSDPTLRRYAIHKYEIQTSEVSRVSQEVLGRVVSHLVRPQVQTAVERYQTDLRTLLQLFRKIDQIGAAKRESINDSFVFMLTKTALARKQSAETVTEMFLQIDKLGANTKKGFRLGDLEVSALTDIAFEYKLSASELMKRFFDLDKTAQARAKAKDFDSLDDASLVYLTKLSLERKDLNPEQIADHYIAAFIKGKTTEEDFYIDPLATTILMVTGKANKKSIDEANKAFFEMKNDFINLGKRTGFNEEYAHMTELALSTGLNSKQLVELMSEVSSIAGGNVSVLQVKNIIATSVIVSLERTQNPLPSRNILAEVMYLKPTDNLQHLDYLVAATTANKLNRTQREIAAGLRTVKRKSNATSYASSSPTSLNSPIDFYIDPNDGIKMSANLGSGVGIDLSDGSLVIGSGSFKIDTDGDGMGFHF